VIVSAEAGEQTLDFAGILVLQKDFDRWAFTYNLGLETAFKRYKTLLVSEAK